MVELRGKASTLVRPVDSWAWQAIMDDHPPHGEAEASQADQHWMAAAGASI